MAYSDVILATSGLQSYWRLGETVGSGTVADSQGSVTGTVTNGVLGTAGLLIGDGNTAWSSDGTGDFIKFGDVYDFSGSAAFSVEMWIKRTGVTTFRNVISTEGSDGGGAQGWRIQWNGSFAPLFQRFQNGGVTTVTPSVALAVNTTHHLVATFNGSTGHKVYIDGVEVGSATGTRSIVANAAELTLGAKPDGTGAAQAIYDEVAIYNVALDLSTIQAHYAIGSIGPDQTAYAVSTTSAGTWTAVGAATIHEAIDETSPSDAEYAQSTQSPASASAVRIKFGALTDPISSIDHIISYRLGKDVSGGDTIQVTAKLYQASTLISTDPSTRTVPDSFTTYSWEISGAEADSITDYSDLHLDISAIKV